MKKIGGLRRKTRSLFKKHKRGKLSLTRYLQAFESGDRVVLSLESSVHKGLYHPRFHAKTGVIKAKKGKCYEIMLTDGGKQKTLIVHPIHLRKV